jgi:hypothetical protein
MSKKILKKILPKTFLDKLRILKYVFQNKLQYSEDCLYTTVNADFLKDPKFVQSYGLAKGLMQDSWDGYDFRWRAYVVCWAASQAKNLEGDFVECGVNTGMNTRMVIDYMDFDQTDKTYYLLDTYTGMAPKYSSEEEMIRSRNMGYTEDIYESVKNTFKDFKNVKLVKGAIPDTLTKVPSQKVAFLTIDMNCVMPEVAALEYFWDKMVPGGIIIMDDHGFPGHDEQRNAHKDFAKKHGTMVLPLPTGQGMIIKT